MTFSYENAAQIFTELILRKLLEKSTQQSMHFINRHQ